jgi:hypothetical protein
MKAAIVFAGTGPLLILTSYPSISDPNFVGKLKAKGLQKFIAFEIPLDQCRERYGPSYRDIVEDLQKIDDMRVLDFDGHRIFRNFTLKKMGAPFFFEE